MIPIDGKTTMCFRIDKDYLKALKLISSKAGISVSELARLGVRMVVDTICMSLKECEGISPESDLNVINGMIAHIVVKATES